MFNAFSSLLNVPLVPWNEWLSRLENNGGDPAKNPAVHLLDFYHGSTASGEEYREALGMPLLDLSEAVKSSANLADPSLPQVSRQDAEQWFGYWRRKGLVAAKS